MERRLAAILAADVVGYSRLMGVVRAVVLVFGVVVGLHVHPRWGGARPARWGTATPGRDSSIRGRKARKRAARFRIYGGSSYWKVKGFWIVSQFEF